MSNWSPPSNSHRMDPEEVPSSDESVMEGWLYLIPSRKFSSRPWIRKRYFVLNGSYASWYKARPAEKDDKPLKSGYIDSYYLVEDNGREKIHRRALFVFTLYNPYTHQEYLKFGAQSAGEAGRWITAFKSAASQAGPSKPGESFAKRSTSRYSGGVPANNRVAPNNDFPDWTGSLSSQDGQADVVTTSPWRIFGCRNGLRLFTETSDEEFRSTLRSYDPPAIMAVGVVNSTCESVFDTVLELGPSRLQWDFCFLRGKVVERVDGHTDVIHEEYDPARIRGKIKPRDLLLVRYWRREDDGSYVILYRSIDHEKCPPQKGFKRAFLKSGGYVISPLKSNRTVVKHMVAANWRIKHYGGKSLQAEEISLRILERVAALREMYEALPSSPTVKETAHTPLPRYSFAVQSNLRDRVTEDMEVQGGADERHELGENKEVKPLDLSEVVEIFYDVPESPEEFEDGGLEMEGSEDEEEHKEKATPKFTIAAAIVKRLHELSSTAQKRSQPPKTHEEENELLNNQGSLPKCSSVITESCWCTPEPETFRVRSKSYLRNQAKVKANGQLLQLVACDWLKSDKRESHLASRSSNIIHSFQGTGDSNPFFFVFNIQVPGKTNLSLLLYYVTRWPLDSIPLLKAFVEGDDRYRNSRFKLIPHIAKGSWIVKQSVGKSACLIGQALEIEYYRGKNYIELDVNIGSSSVARGVVNLVLGYLGKLVVEMAFLIQANSDEELPEQLLGTCRLIQLDVEKAVALSPG